MAKTIDIEGIKMLIGIESEEELQLGDINPPPRDGRCICCERHLSELTPFGKTGDPPVDTYDGALLVKIYKLFSPVIEKLDRIINHFFRKCETDADRYKAENKLVQEYGQLNADRIMFLHGASKQIDPLWLCKDCIILDDDEYYKKIDWDMQSDYIWADSLETPDDDRCDCCGRSLCKLKPFGKAGDPFMRDYNGELLVKTWSHDDPNAVEACKIIKDFYGNCHTEEDYKKADEMVFQKYGKDEAMEIIFEVITWSYGDSSWLCRDCIICDPQTDFDALYDRWRNTDPSNT